MEIQIAGGGAQQVSDDVFGRDFNEALIHQVVTAFMAGARQGTKAQKTRSDVSGGGKKLGVRKVPAVLVQVRSVVQFGVRVVSPLLHVLVTMSKKLTAKCTARLFAASCQSWFVRTV